MNRFLFTVGLFFSIGLQAQQRNYLEPLHYFEGTRFVRNGLFTPKTPSFEQIQRDFSARKFQSYEEFLDYLFLESPELKKRYVLVHQSESQQLSSLEHPRVLLFWGAIAYGLSDHPAQNSRRVEILETSEKDYTISLSEIEFTKGKVIFRKNPESCTVCHGSPAKPLWNPYDFWPNAFGSAIGNFYTQKEVDAYKSLRDRAGESPILKRLFLPEKYDLESENLTAFTQTMHQMNLGRWIHQNLTPEKFSQAQAYPLIAILSSCTSPFYYGAAPEHHLEEYLDDSNSTLQDSPSLEDWHREVSDSRAQFKKFLDSILFGIFANSEPISFLDHSRLKTEVSLIANLQWYMGRVGVDMSDLTTSLYMNDYLFSSPSNFSADFLTSLYVIRPDLFEGVQTKAQFLGGEQPSWIDTDCNSLAAPSKAASRKLVPRPIFSHRLSNPKQPVLSRCAKCHIETEANRNSAIPKIPFNKTMELSKLLSAPGAGLKNEILKRVKTQGAGQMPPGQTLTEAEIRSLEEYLSNLTVPPIEP